MNHGSAFAYLPYEQAKTTVDGSMFMLQIIKMAMTAEWSQTFVEKCI